MEALVLHCIVMQVRSAFYSFYFWSRNPGGLEVRA